MELIERMALVLFGLGAQMKQRLAAEDGATAVEYGLLVALIAAVIIGTVVFLGGQINAAFCQIVNGLGGGGPC